MCFGAVCGDASFCFAAMNLLLLVVSRSPESVKNIVLVCGDNEFVHWEAHAFRKVARKYISRCVVSWNSDHA